MNKNPIIHIQDVTKTYSLYASHADRIKEAFHPFRKKYHHPYHALKDFSLDIYQGEFVGIIGRNGSGKSTLLQLMSNILQPTTGSVSVIGNISALLELGAGFNPEFTGRENVFLNASILGIEQSEAERIFPKIIEFADIGEFIDQPVKTYSSGMYVRLAFAVAISVKPDILIVDEALAVGDIFFQQKCIRYMEEEMKGCTKVLVTHDMHAVMNLCERVVVLDDGRSAFIGPPLESVEYYTKTVHNELFAVSESSSNDDAEALEKTGTGAVAIDRNDTAWVKVQAESVGGASEVIIKKASLTTTEKETVAAVKYKDLLLIRMQLEIKNDIAKPIFGYMVKDRVGNGICGDNSLSLPGRMEPLQKGVCTISFTISWPDIAPDDYLITLGVGQGDHPLHHVIQCWAHNVLLVKAICPGNVVHGLFTNSLLSCEVEHFDR